MTKEEFTDLTLRKVESFIEENLDKDPAKLALSSQGSPLPIPLIASQLKYLQRARTKLPTYYNHRCILPPRAFEQSTSERSAALKPFQGSLFLDLTAGLGVDSKAMASIAEALTCVERDPVLCEVLTHNFAKIGLPLPQIINDSAESFIQTYQGPEFDMVYLDPDRRGEGDIRLEDPALFSPNLFNTLPRLLEIGKEVWVKFSPLHDVYQIPVQFPQTTSVMVISVDGECKEVLAVFQKNMNTSLPSFQARISRAGESWSYLFHRGNKPSNLIDPSEPYMYLHQADVSLYKLRRVSEWWAEVAPTIKGGMNHPQGYFFSQEGVSAALPVRSYAIIRVFLYKPKKIKKTLQNIGIKKLEISKRQFPFSVAEIRKSIGIQAGGTYHLICTTFPDGSKRAFLCEIES
ncbi:MAG: RsmD family RNA methyltransferase [Bacteroidota bacterium]